MDSLAICVSMIMMDHYGDLRFYDNDHGWINFNRLRVYDKRALMMIIDYVQIYGRHRCSS